jgi:hypothetical protein
VTAITALDIKDLMEKLELECVDMENMPLCVQFSEDDDVVYNVGIQVDDFGEGPVLVVRHLGSTR